MRKRLPEAELARQGRARYGERFPSRSALNRFAIRHRAAQVRPCSVEEVILLAARLPEPDRAAMATKLLLSISTPDMAPALMMASGMIRHHAVDLGRALPKGVMQ